MKIAVAVTAVAAVLALPGAGAVISTNDQIAAFEALLGAAAPLLPAELPPLPGAPGFYVDDAGNVWQESNGVAGLQTEAGTDEHGAAFDADAFVAGPASLPPL